MRRNAPVASLQDSRQVYSAGHLPGMMVVVMTEDKKTMIILLSAVTLLADAAEANVGNDHCVSF